ncbi:MAG: hypothetical protein ABI162_03105 [Luteolibacter sp.]
MKKPHLLAAITASVLVLNACDSKKAGGKSPEKAAAAQQDTPILPVKKGDVWRYDVHLEIPADVTSPGAAEVNETHRRTRTYLGKVSPAAGLPEVDCFEVIAPNTPTEREFVDISDDRILMRGSMIMLPETTRPMWLDRPVPFVVAGMKAGTELPELESASGGFSKRKTQVVARENVTVPAGNFPSIRILMTGKDGDFELRRTTWFSPGIGIVREEKTRYRKDKLLFHETQQLVETLPKRP